MGYFRFRDLGLVGLIVVFVLQSVAYLEFFFVEVLSQSTLFSLLRTQVLVITIKFCFLSFHDATH